MSGDSNVLKATPDLAKDAWETMGQFTVPDVAKTDPDGRRTLYVAGFIAGYMAACAQPSVMPRPPECRKCNGTGSVVQHGSYYDCPACNGKGF